MSVHTMSLNFDSKSDQVGILFEVITREGLVMILSLPNGWCCS